MYIKKSRRANSRRDFVWQAIVLYSLTNLAAAVSQLLLQISFTR